MIALVEVIHKNLKELDYDLWIKIVKLYVSNPIDHCYLMNGLLYNPERSDTIFVIKNGVITGYVYASTIRGGLRIVLWGETSPKHLSSVLDKSTFVIINFQKDAEEIEVEPYLTALVERKYRNPELSYFYDMVTDEERFKPYRAGNVRKLNEADLDAFIEIRKIHGRPVSREEALELIKQRRFYGVYENDKLVGIAGARIKLPEIWIIGNVFVHPDYRGRGYGKAVTSAITEDAVKSGALAYLQVETTNSIAINIYEKLGYRTIRKNPWIFAEKEQYN
uniref:GNAT family N-acetyltransferase n=1 Tax=Staphylothermus marinus TaxID=2280 RepID=A0A7C4HDB9_STAMA